MVTVIKNAKQKQILNFENLKILKNLS